MEEWLTSPALSYRQVDKFSIMRTELACFVLFYVIKLASAGEENITTEQVSWNTTFDKLFASNGIALSKEETLQMLNQLATSGDSSSALESVKLDMVNGLIKMSQLSQNKCSASTFKLFNLKLEEYESAKVNILPFLQSWKLKQFEICSSVYREQLRSHQSWLTNQKLKDLKTLRMWTVYYPKINYLDDDQHQLIEGLVQFYQYQARNSLKDKPPNNYIYKREIIELNSTCTWARFSGNLNQATEEFKKHTPGR